MGTSSPSRSPARFPPLECDLDREQRRTTATCQPPDQIWPNPADRDRSAPVDSAGWYTWRALGPFQCRVARGKGLRLMCHVGTLQLLDKSTKCLPAHWLARRQPVQWQLHIAQSRSSLCGT